MTPIAMACSELARASTRRGAKSMGSSDMVELVMSMKNICTTQKPKRIHLLSLKGKSRTVRMMGGAAIQRNGIRRPQREIV